MQVAACLDSLLSLCAKFKTYTVLPSDRFLVRVVVLLAVLLVTGKIKSGLKTLTEVCLTIMFSKNGVQTQKLTNNPKVVY